jgi:branched-chain amino acid transport system substrate-binding protein
MTQAAKMGYAPTYFGVDGMDGILDLEGFDTNLAEGVLLLTPFTPYSEDAKVQEFVKAYEDAYGETPIQFAADAYDCVFAIAQALKNGNATPDMSTDELTDILVKQFTSMTYDGITGESMTWSETGEVTKAPQAVIIKDGVYVGAE